MASYEVESEEAATPRTFEVESEAPIPSVGADMAKAIPRGLAKGTAGVVGLPGAIQQGTQSLSDLVSGAIGNAPPSAAEKEAREASSWPTPDSIQKQVERVTGPWGKAETKPGKYVENAAEFVPGGMIGPGGWLGKLVTAITGGLGSEVAGQLTEGSVVEPYARAAGGVAGGVLPMAGARTITPLPAGAERRAAVERLREEGIHPTAGQSTGSKSLQYAEGHLGDAPFAGNQATRQNERAGEEFTRAALRRVGVDAERATPEVIDQALTRMGGEFDRLASNNPLTKDTQLAQDIFRAGQQYESLVPPSMRKPIVEGVLDDFANGMITSPTMTGEQYKVLRSKIDATRRSASADPELAEFMASARNALDDAMERSMTAAGSPDVGAWRDVRTQYRNFLPIEKAVVGGGEQAAEGILTPGKMRQAVVQKHGERNYARGEGDFAEVVRDANSVMTPLPNSGTAQRSLVASIPASIGAALGAPGGVPGAVVGAAAGAAAPAAAGRAIMSRPVQGYLGNQSLTDIIENLPGVRRALANSVLETTRGQ